MEVIVLNKDYSILNTIGARKAVSKIASDDSRPSAEKRYEVLQNYEKQIGKYKIPKVIRLLHSVEIIHKRKQAWSKHNVLIRDNFTCQYCLKKFNIRELEIEHVIPRCQGGKTTWENTVASCHACNQKKANKTPQQANMTLKRKPYHPSISDFFMLKAKALGSEDFLVDLFK